MAHRPELPHLKRNTWVFYTGVLPALVACGRVPSGSRLYGTSGNPYPRLGGTFGDLWAFCVRYLREVSRGESDVMNFGIYDCAPHSVLPKFYAL